jgi:ABC-type oligopeptide transport system ATPase subunit
MVASILVAKELSKSIIHKKRGNLSTQEILRNVSIEVKPQDCVGIIGASGSGKAPSYLY